MSPWLPWVAAALVALAAAAAEPDPAPAEEASGDEQPAATELVEEARARLTQVDVTVLGPSEIIGNLTAEDFKVRLGFKRVREFQLDNFCGGPLATAEGAGENRLAAARPPAPRASYLFYFDQPHLTLSGRRRSMQLARELIPRLIRGENRAMVVSNATDVVTLETFTADVESLLAAIDRLESDPKQWDTFAQQELSRIEDVVRALNDSENISAAVAKARVYQRDERWRTDKDLRRLESVLARLADVDPPKAAIYFADTLRVNAGEHYLSFFGSQALETDPVLTAIPLDAFAGTTAFDRVVNQASAQGIRLYTVQAEGLVAHMDSALPSSRAGNMAGRTAQSSRVRTLDAHNTLRSMSSETGGYAFINGAEAPVITDRIQDDFSCLYLISFDPSGYMEDAPHRVVVEVKHPEVVVRSRGRVVIQSQKTRLTSRLLAAFSAPDAVPDELEVHGALVPTGFRDGAYSALVQVAVPGLPLPGTTWDMGASLVSRDKVQAETSGRMSVSGAGVPVILESEIRFPPGEHELVAVARESRTDLIGSVEADGFWPDPKRGPASVGPIALLQPTEGVFLRDGNLRTSGSLARYEGQPVYTDRPTAFVALACRGRSDAVVIRVERSLSGDSTVEFPPIEVDLSEERCAQFRDLVPARTLGPGPYRYEIRVLHDGNVVARGERTFLAAEPEARNE